MTNTLPHRFLPEEKSAGEMVAVEKSVQIWEVWDAKAQKELTGRGMEKSYVRGDLIGDKYIILAYWSYRWVRETNQGDSLQPREQLDPQRLCIW